MPLTRELTHAVREELREEVDWEHVPYLDSNFEKAMSYLNESEPWLSEPERLQNRALFLMISGAIHSAIVRAQGEMLEQVHQCPEWLLGLVAWMHLNRAVVLTLNYDTLLEMAASELYLGGGRMLTSDDLRPFLASGERVTDRWDGWSTFALLKLHGSLHWTYSGTDSYFGEPIQDAVVPRWSKGWLGGLGCDPADGRVPLIVPPTFNKSRYFENEKLRWLWRRSALALALARRVFCVGYSLPEGDLLMRFLLDDAKPAVNEEIPFYLVNTDPGCSTQFEGLPHGFKVSTEFVCGENLNPVCLFTDALLRGDLDTAHSRSAPSTNLPSLSELLRRSCPEGTKQVNMATGGEFEVLRVGDYGVLMTDPSGGTHFALWRAFEACLRAAAGGSYKYVAPSGMSKFVESFWSLGPTSPLASVVPHPCEQQILSLLCACRALESATVGPLVRFNARDDVLEA